MVAKRGPEAMSVMTTRTHAHQRAFTLVELLVVMAITAILLGLIFGPLVQGFNLTNRARLQILAQDTARSVMETLQRQVAEGAFVFDNSGSAVNLWIEGPGGNPEVRQIPFALLDLVPPAHINDQTVSLDPANVDPTTGLAIDRGPVALPVRPGRVIVRYFLGLRFNGSEDDPGGTTGRPMVLNGRNRVYRNRFDDPGNVPGDLHNPVLLYRAVVSPYLPNGNVDGRLFRTDSGGRPVIYDANFFYDNGVAAAAYPGWRDLNGDGQPNFSENWRAASTSLVPVDRADMVACPRRADGRPDYTRVNPLVRFQPSYVGSDAGAPSRTTDTGNEAPDVAPSASWETYGHWTTPYRVYVFRSALDANPLRYFLYTGSGPIRYQEATFDVGSGQWTVTTDRSAGFDPANPVLSPGDAPEIVFTVNPRKGAVGFAFPDSIYLHDGNGNPAPSRFDPAEANQRYDAVVQAGGPLNAYRYVSLAGDPGTGLLSDGRMSPLAAIPNARIVPGSEVVRGPDQRPGPNYGREVVYTRVPRGRGPMSLGPNEYMINYTDIDNAVDLSDPMQRRGTVVFNSRPDVPGVTNSLPRLDQDDDGQADVPITITYQLQSNLPTDAVKADYLTRELMNFSVGVRLYDPRSGQPQQVTLAQRIQVRNLQR